MSSRRTEVSRSTSNSGRRLAIDVKLWTTKAEIAGAPLDAQKTLDFGKYIRYGASCPKTLGLGGARWHYLAKGLGSPVTYSQGHALGEALVAWIDARSMSAALGFSAGADPCTLYVAPMLIHPVPVVVKGPHKTAGFSWRADQLFRDPAVRGAKVYAQHAAVTTTRQIQLTHGLAITIGWGPQRGLPDIGGAYGLNWTSTGKIYDPDKSPPTGTAGAVPVFGIIKG